MKTLAALLDACEGASDPVAALRAADALIREITDTVASSTDRVAALHAIAGALPDIRARILAAQAVAPAA